MLLTILKIDSFLKQLFQLLLPLVYEDNPELFTSDEMPRISNFKISSTSPGSQA